MFLKKINLYDFLIILFPLAILSGSAIINIFLVLISVFFLFHLKNNLKIFLNYWVISFLFFWFYLILISFYSENFLSSFQSSVSQIRFFLFVLYFVFIFNLKKNINFFILIIHLILLFVCLDVNLQFLSGYDIFGYPSEGYKNLDTAFSHWKNNNMNVGRLSGPFGDELIPGSFIAKLSCPIIFYQMSKLHTAPTSTKLKNILFLLFLFESVFITGERLAFIIICAATTTSFFIYYNFKKTLIFLLTLIFFLLFLYSKIDNENFFKKRIEDTTNIVLNVNESSYGRIFTSAFQIWSNNKIFGVGLKNYRIQCPKLTDPKPNSPHPYCSPTHPHNIVLEFLAELGVLGLLLFLVFNFCLIAFFFKNLKNTNIFYRGLLYGAIFHTFFILIPFLPSGSFFSTFNASLYWLNLGIALSCINTAKFNGEFKKI
jgi:hypothetical protein